MSIRPDHPSPGRLHHIFVDFENVPQIDLEVLGRPAIYFTLLVGAQQTRLDAALVEKLFALGTSVQLVRMTSLGKDALDFTLAYYVGRAAVTDPTASFHIVSKDKGFDPLVAHLQARDITASRHDDFTTLNVLLPALPSATSLEEALVRICGHLRKMPNNRPKKPETLVNLLRSLMGKESAGADVIRMAGALRAAGHVQDTADGSLSYHL